MKKYFKTLFLGLSFLFLLAGCASNQPALNQPTLDQIKSRGTILVGATGDYKPLSVREQNGTLWGFDIDIAKAIAEKLGVEPEFVATSWPSLSDDTMAERFDIATTGITINETRKKTMLMSDGYLASGKTILCRKGDAAKFTSLESIDKKGVRVMINPGGTNEKFARANFKNAKIIVHKKNAEIPAQIAKGVADVMITETTEAPYYVANNPKLAAPLLESPFTRDEIGALMSQNKGDLQSFVNKVIAEMKANGELKKITEKYGLVYSY
ncbi:MULTISPECIES: transporter substrate-binding domain-containing protein [unclassified Campylobacter]|uniref:transporter substrate-binding domain-containing protein n=1 Tax=unclassified Campylobacter TaxID=2593542 RepID=UPI0022E9EB09|nr:MULTISPECIES: transporter substrate-binding domain-containing protein [unclassified Campylobacter]MDA3053745.1 transporter substrate-binding domain-containing protein [Campylobacter sp. VBCF_07 NA4]MDA3060366.1 transporter substrate-binding domain-containing protein [Campylobacter sp. VBCF_02 NA5]MDA3069876.1 transporter substrate-binding domain-containing protein [Campylobacter sp. VBCF_08 NA3]WBR54797.1 transporter substrate-binding domain-containing protein [Campylobacter sp. VBCF_01 NA2]